MRIGVPKEIHPGEKRVATTPAVTAELRKLGFDVSVESGAGLGASYSDEDFRAAGATVADTAAQLWDSSDVILKVRAPEAGAMPFMPRLRTPSCACCWGWKPPAAARS